MTNHDFDTKVAYLVERLARERHVSRQDMADALGIHMASLSNKLIGKRKFTTEELIVIAGMLRMTSGELMERIERATSK